MRKIFLVILIISLPLNMVSSQVKPYKSIRDVEFEPRTTMLVNESLKISIPSSWKGELLKTKEDNKVISYIFSDRNPKFSASINIFFKSDKESTYEKEKEVFMQRLYGENIDKVHEQDKLYEFLDSSSTKKEIFYGPSYLTGNAFLYILYYKEIKTTVVITYSLVYVEDFSFDEMNYIMFNSINIIGSIRKVK